MSIEIGPAASPDRRLAIITALINGRQTQEQVDLARQDGRWIVADARMTVSDRPTTAPATRPETH